MHISETLHHCTTRNLIFRTEVETDRFTGIGCVSGRISRDSSTDPSGRSKTVTFFFCLVHFLKLNSSMYVLNLTSLAIINILFSLSLPSCIYSSYRNITQKIVVKKRHQLPVGQVTKTQRSSIIFFSSIWGLAVVLFKNLRFKIDMS